MKLTLGWRIQVEVLEKGRLVHLYEAENLITNVGRAQTAALLVGTATLPFKYIALGTGTNPADVADVMLQTERIVSDAARKLGTVSILTGSVSNDTGKVQATYDITNGFTLTEIGLFDAIAAGNMAARRQFSGIVISGGQQLVVTWQLKVL